MSGGLAGARIARVRVSPHAPQVCRIDLEPRGTLRLDADTARALGLAAGTEVDADLAAHLLQAAGRHEARVIALRLLQRRLRSRAEMEAALRRRGVTTDAILAVVGDLVRSGWLDDARFARAWVSDRLALRPAGRRRLRAELLARGIEPALADEVLAEAVSPEHEEAQVAALASRRLTRLRGQPAKVQRRRLVAWLQRRGYPAATVARAVRALLTRDTDLGDVESIP